MRFSSASMHNDVAGADILSNFCHSFSTRTVRTIRTGRVDTGNGRGVWQTSCEMDWPCPPSFLLKGDLDFSTLLPDDAAHPVAAIG